MRAGITACINSALACRDPPACSVRDRQSGILGPAKSKILLAHLDPSLLSPFRSRSQHPPLPAPGQAAWW